MDEGALRSKDRFVPYITMILSAPVLICTLELLQVLQPAASFVTYASMDAAFLSHSGTRKQCNSHARTAIRRFALLAQASHLDEDLPGIADTRLAGWRVGSQVENNPGAVESTSSSPLVSSGAPGEPGCGDVVEYQLSERAKEEANDGREKGVAVIVSINKHRNDAWTLPEDILDKAELQVLCPDLESQEENVWMADELESCAFASLGGMKVLKSEFNGALDKWKRWKIKDELSQGCGARDAGWEYNIV